MAIKTILFAVGFLVACIGALFVPLLGVLGYVAHYNLGPEQQWWTIPLRPLGIRYSLILAVATGIGMLLHLRNLRFGTQFLVTQEKMILLFLGIVWFTILISEPTRETTVVLDHPSVKLTKVVIFVLMMTHIVTTLRDLDWLFWVLVASALVLGLQAYYTPRSVFVSGRLETVGGPDFSASNDLAAYLSAILPLIGIQFLRSGWRGKLFCLVAGAFSTNAIILTRSRGAVVAIVVGVLTALALAPTKHRGKIAVGVAVALLAGLHLADPGFLGRAGTIDDSMEQDQRDRSSQARVEIWEGGIRMLLDNPLGVGSGNFQQTIGRYVPQHPNRDAHNMFIRCGAELGFPGLIMMVALIIGTFVSLARTLRWAVAAHPAEESRVVFIAYGLRLSLVIFLVSGMFGTLFYMEAFWWLLALPICLTRVVGNLKEDALLEAAPATPGLAERLRSALPGRLGRRAKVPLAGR
jgi:O-antigen ligase